MQQCNIVLAYLWHLLSQWTPSGHCHPSLPWRLSGQKRLWSRWSLCCQQARVRHVITSMDLQASDLMIFRSSTAVSKEGITCVEAISMRLHLLHPPSRWSLSGRCRLSILWRPSSLKRLWLR